MSTNEHWTTMKTTQEKHCTRLKKLWYCVYYVCMAFYRRVALINVRHLIKHHFLHGTLFFASFHFDWINRRSEGICQWIFNAMHLRVIYMEWHRINYPHIYIKGHVNALFSRAQNFSNLSINVHTFLTATIQNTQFNSNNFLLVLFDSSFFWSIWLNAYLNGSEFFFLLSFSQWENLILWISYQNNFQKKKKFKNEKKNDDDNEQLSSKLLHMCALNWWIFDMIRGMHVIN